MEKPITLQIEQFKQDLVHLVNESGIPVFLLDYIYISISDGCISKLKNEGDLYAWKDK